MGLPVEEETGGDMSSEREDHRRKERAGARLICWVRRRRALLAGRRPGGGCGRCGWRIGRDALVGWRQKSRQMVGGCWLDWAGEESEEMAADGTAPRSRVGLVYIVGGR